MDKIVFIPTITTGVACFLKFIDISTQLPRALFNITDNPKSFSPFLDQIRIVYVDSMGNQRGKSAVTSVLLGKIVKKQAAFNPDYGFSADIPLKFYKNLNLKRKWKIVDKNIDLIIEHYQYAKYKGFKLIPCLHYWDEDSCNKYIESIKHLDIDTVAIGNVWAESSDMDIIRDFLMLKRVMKKNGVDYDIHILGMGFRKRVLMEITGYSFDNAVYGMRAMRGELFDDNLNKLKQPSNIRPYSLKEDVPEHRSRNLLGQWIAHNYMKVLKYIEKMNNRNHSNLAKFGIITTTEQLSLTSSIPKKEPKIEDYLGKRKISILPNLPRYKEKLKKCKNCSKLIAIHEEGNVLKVICDLPPLTNCIKETESPLSEMRKTNNSNLVIK